MKRLLLVALLLCAFAVPVIIEAKGLERQSDCQTSTHFVITGVSANVAPASIVIERAGHLDEIVPFERVVGNVAHYSTTNLLGVPIVRAWTHKPSGWAGQFNLSCTATAVTLSSFSASSAVDARLMLALCALVVAALILLVLRRIGV